MDGKLRLIGQIGVVVLVALVLGAPTCDQSYNETTGTMTGLYPCDGGGDCILYGAGDSIAAGNEESGTGTLSDGGRRASYIRYFADNAAAANGWSVNYIVDAVSGEVTAGIYNLMSAAEVSSAHLVLWSAGGNDFLDARSAYAGSCNVPELDQALANWRNAYDPILALVAANARPGGIVQTMNIYYPNPLQDMEGFCGATDHFTVFLPRLLSAADYICHSAELNGFACADSITAMNCSEDANGNPPANCPNKRWLQKLVDEGTCVRQPSTSTYDVLDPECIAVALDLDGAWGEIHDPLAVDKAGTVLDLIQNDRTHPNHEGHRQIGAQHHDLGYNGFALSPNGTFWALGNYESTYAMCIDSLDNDNDGDVDCADPNCAPYCPSTAPDCVADAECDDGDVCNGAEICVDGACVAGSALFCDDGSACTTDSCDPASGCSNTAVSCDDGNACTTDSCDPASGCSNVAQSCDDGDACTADSCDPGTGACANDVLSCDDGDACTTDACDPATGCSNTAVSCDDGDACTADSCDPATGCENTAVSCDDGDPCTADSCDPASGCVNTPIAGCNACTPTGDACGNHGDCCSGSCKRDRSLGYKVCQ